MGAALAPFSTGKKDGMAALPLPTLVEKTTTARCGITTPCRVLLNASHATDAVAIRSLGSNGQRPRGQAYRLIGKQCTTYRRGGGL